MTEIQVNLRLENELAIIDLQGDVTSAAEKRIASAYERAAAQKVQFVILNFSRVGYINSAGMSIIISLLTRSQSENRKLYAFGLTPHYQQIFGMVGLLKYVPHFPDEEQARRHCAKAE